MNNDIIKKITMDYNKLPFDERKMISKYSLLFEILILKQIKQRIENNYKREMKYISERIKTFENALDEE